MKKLGLFALLIVALASCGDGGSKTYSPDTTVAPSDTTGLHVNPALADPNSNMADTMKIVDSTRVRDTSVKDKTATKPKRN